MTTSPVAVIGIGCRFPGGNDTPQQFWEYLMAGRDAAGPIPPERWEPYERLGGDTARVVRQATARGSFLEDPAAFDANFFGVTPREAELMDPQQRLALETTWEALEHAGIPPHSLAGSDTAVYMGVAVDDYGRQMLEDLPRLEAWCGVGAAYCGVPNRISYVLDLCGASLAVDTACSSSLAAIHLACGALRAGETSLAIAGGVGVLASPGMTVVLDKAGATSPRGRSRPFDADADGYGRGEGSGIVVLKLLADAVRDGDRVLAVVRGTAISQDGRTNGIMAPNVAAQAHVARLAWAQAGIEPSTADYVEAHGTGTRTGDPVEAEALSAVFGRDRDRPCLIGSVKGNIGHLEAGAGVAGVIKVVLSLGHGWIPPQAGFSTPNPLVPWDRSGLRIATEAVPWPEADRPGRAGVSAFGYGGTVAHVVLEQAPATAPPAGPEPGIAVYPLSGATAQAVRDHAAALADELGCLADLKHTLWARRSHLAHRAAVVAADEASLRYELRRLAADQPSPGCTAGQVVTAQDAVWVFSGHGSQWSGMGRELLATSAPFAEVIDALDPIFRAELEFSPREALSGGELGGVDRIQALIVAIQLGVAAVWRDLGLRPSAVIGHSVGEIAAAVTAGVLSLHDGARLLCRRSRQVARAAGGGTMAMVALPFDEVTALLLPGDVVAAVESAPRSTVVAGTVAGVEAFTARCAADGVMVRKVASDVAFHSGQMDPLVAGLVEAVADLEPAAPALPVYATAVDDPRTSRPRDARYWAANLRNPVRFATAVTAAIEDGHRAFLEVSPHPVVTHSISETLAELGVQDAFVGASLRRARPEEETLLLGLAALHCHGVPVDQERHARGGSLATLPRIAWQHKRFWRELGARGDGIRLHDVDSCSLLGSEVPIALAGATRIWRTILDFETRPYPGTHPVHGVEIVPAAVMIATCGGAAGQLTLRDVDMRVPITMDPPREVQVLEQDGRITLASRPASAREGGWEIHATATVAPGHAGITELKADCPSALPSGSVVDRLRAVGITGTGFPWTIESLRGGDGELLARVAPGSATDPTARWASLLDAVMTIAPLLYDQPGEPPALRITTGAEYVSLGTVPSAVATVHVRLTGDVVDAVVAGSDGEVTGIVGGLRYGSLTGTTARRPLAGEVAWCPVDDRPGDPPRTVVTIGREIPGATPIELAQLPAAGLDDQDAVLVFDDDAMLRTAELLSGMDSPPALWGVTTGVREGAVSPLWGYGSAIDLPPDGDTQGLFAVLRAGPAPDVYAPRDGVVEARRFTAGARTEVRCDPSAAYLVAGAPDGPAMRAATWLADRGARRILLSAPTGLSRAEWPDALLSLEARGIGVRVGTGLRRPWDSPEIRGVVFAGGTIEEALAVDRCYPEGSLDFLVFVTSGAQLVDIDGPAPRDAVLDCLGRGRRDARSVAVDPELSAAEWSLDADVLLCADRVDSGAPFLAGLAAEPEPPVADELGALDPSDRRDRLHEEVASHIAAEIRMSRQELDMHRPLTQLGLDSVMMTAIRDRLSRRFELELPPTLMWRMPTGAAVADHLADLLEA